MWLTPTPCGGHAVELPDFVSIGVLAVVPATGTEFAMASSIGGQTVRHNLALVIGACVVSVSAITWTYAQQTKPVSAPGAPMTMDDLLREVRADVQADRADLMAKNVSLTSAQAAKFWPLFEAYQKEQAVIMDDQLKNIQWYIEHFETADDAAALRLINAHFDRDAKMTALQKKWFAEFQKVLGTKLAVRVVQIDRRLSLAHQAFITSKIPLSR